jgi:anti-sigma-K factor RskA
MNIANNQALLDRLSMAYALGTLRGRARRRFETMASQQSNIRACMLIWQSRLSSLTELQNPQMPGPSVWWRIEQQIKGSTVNLAPTQNTVEVIGAGRWWQNLRLWQVGTAFATIAAIGLGLSKAQLETEFSKQLAALTGQLQIAKNTAERVQYVAVLLDQKASEAVLVTLDSERKNIRIKRVNGFKENDNQTLQLWAIAPDEKPKSLGMLNSEQLEQALASLFNPQSGNLLAISLEPKGGVPEAGGPTGPVLFKGTLLKTPM